MTLTEVDADASAQPATGHAGSGAPAGRLRAHRADLLVLLGYLAVAGFTMRHLLIGPATRIAAGNPRGQSFDEWMLRHGARVLTRGASPFFSDRMSIPDGVNPLATHGFPGLSVPLAPLTLWLGPARTYALAVTLCLAATAYAWYHVLSRHLVTSRSAAVVGGALGGLGPAMVSHAQGDLSRTAMFLVPFLIWRTVRLREPGGALRNGLVLGVLAAGQLLIDEEVLFLVAVGWAIFLLVYALQRREEVRRQAPTFLRGLAVAVVTFVVLAGYPLWTQFLGPQPHGPAPASVGDHGSDLFSFFAFPWPSLGTWPVGQLHYAKVGTEQNTFYGWPLLLMLIGSLWLLRTAVVRALAATAFVLALLSLGSEIVVKGRDTHVPAPWRLFADLPGLRSVPPTDLALAVFPVIVLVVALIVQWGSELVAGIQAARPDAPARIAWWGLLVAALVPLAPAAVQVTNAPVPAFIADGAWRNYVPAGSSLLAVPPGASVSTAWRWAVSTDLDLPLASGDLGGPLARAASTGRTQTVGERDRQAVRAELVREKVTAVVLSPQRSEDAVRKTTSALLGFYPRWVGGVWLWDLRVVS
jgi:hypothetical protein